MMCSNVLARNFDPSSSSSSHPLDTYIGNLFSQLKWIMYIEYRYQSGGPRTHFSIILKENYNQCSALRLVDLKWNSSDLDIILKQYEYLFLEILSTINFTPKSLDIRQDNCILSYYSTVLQRRSKMDRRRRQRIFGFRKKTEDEDEDSSEFCKIFEDLRR